uniref:Uncharacterized protein n=1 Tax=Pyxicephalus adspersus TaxID=30357 RepID=A0AAV3A9F2_PYXAD|nr:TPA: hypothetical protein GDO54_017634 [Pyxicephalus adspersus]
MLVVHCVSEGQLTELLYMPVNWKMRLFLPDQLRMQKAKTCRLPADLSSITLFSTSFWKIRIQRIHIYLWDWLSRSICSIKAGSSVNGTPMIFKAQLATVSSSSLARINQCLICNPVRGKYILVLVCSFALMLKV